MYVNKKLKHYSYKFNKLNSLKHLIKHKILIVFLK